LTIGVLVLLALVWGAVLYGYFRDRLTETRPADSIGSFRRQLSVLERTGPVEHSPAFTLRPRVPAQRPTYPMASPMSAYGARAAAPVGARRRGPTPAQKRRRDILCGLLAAAAGSLLLGFLPGLRILWGLHVALDVLIAAYVVMLIRRRNVLAEREMKLRFLPASGTAEPALLLRRTGN
jgi:MFS family permease